MSIASDKEHLKILSIFHYVVGGLGALFACFPILHVGIGIAMVAGAFPNHNGNGPPQAFGWLFIILPGFIILTGWTVAVCIIMAGRRLARFTNHTFCLVVAGVECIFMPFGTVLGVFTIIVLMRPSVRVLFGVETDQPEFESYQS